MHTTENVKGLIVSEKNIDYITHVFKDCVKRFKVPPGAIRLYVEENSNLLVTELIKPHYADKFQKFKNRFDRRVHQNGAGKNLKYLMDDGRVMDLDVVPSKELADMVETYKKKKDL